MTDFTLKKLREIVWVELPSIGDNITQNKPPPRTMKSVKATQDLVAPISGTIEEVNEKLKSKPGLLNEDPYGEGWILVVTPTNIDAELRERHGRTTASTVIRLTVFFLAVLFTFFLKFL